MLENPRKLKNSPNLLLLFVKITKFLEFSKSITIKTIVFSNFVWNHFFQNLRKLKNVPIVSGKFV